MAYRDLYTPGKSYSVDGSLLNRIGSDSNATRNSSHGGGGDNVTRLGTSNQQISPPPFRLGVATVVSLLEENLHVVCRFRVWANTSSTWIDFDDVLHLDPQAYFEGTVASDESPSVDIDHDLTAASQSPTSGQGFGPIPIYKVGDNVPAYWDPHRGYLIPIVGTPESDARAYFRNTKPETIRQIGSAGQTVTAVLEAQLQGEWKSVSAITWRVPSLIDDEVWRDCRFGHGLLRAVDGTQLRVRLWTDTIYPVVCESVTVEIFHCSRNPIGLTDSSTGYPRPPSDTGAGSIKSGWSTSFVGGTDRRRVDEALFGVGVDSTIEPGYPDRDTMIVTRFADSKDSGLIGVYWSATIRPKNEEESSESTSVSSPSTYATVYGSKFVCATVVSDVECIDGLVVNVCYTRICFPTIPGMDPDGDGQLGVAYCLPCTTEESSSSSSIVTTTTTTTTASVSTCIPNDCTDYDLDAPPVAETPDRLTAKTFSVINPSHRSSATKWATSLANGRVTVHVGRPDPWNLLPFIQDFEWSSTGAATTPYAGVAPDGTTTALLVESSAIGGEVSYTAAGVGVAGMAFSGYIKSGSVALPSSAMIAALIDVESLINVSSMTKVVLRNVTSATNVAEIDITDWESGDYSLTSGVASIEMAGNGWLRVKLWSDQFSPGDTVQVYAGSGDGVSSYSGQSTLQWGMVLEPAPSIDHVSDYQLPYLGKWSVDNANGTVTYTPAPTGEEAGKDVYEEIFVYDDEECHEDIDESSLSSLSSLSSTSSMSTSSTSVSSTSWSSLSESSLSSSSSSCGDEECEEFALTTPQFAATVTSDTAVTFNVLSNDPTTEWLTVIANDDLEMTVISNTGAGDVTVDPSQSNVTYDPPDGGFEAGETVQVVVRLTDTNTGCSFDVTIVINVSDFIP